MNFKVSLLFVVSVLQVSAFAQTPKTSTTLPLEGDFVKASDSHIQYVGRVCMQKEVASFNFPGVQIRARFNGTSLKMVCLPKTGYFMAQIDDCKPFKVAFNGERDSVVNLATALQYGPHNVKLMYIIEGLFRKPEFKGFLLDEDAKLLEPSPLPERRIEFIGNSITCGYGVESVNASDPFEDETENHGLTYANIVSDSLNALHTSISRSGIGVYRNYNGPKTGTPENMPWQYEYTLFNNHDEKWDFSKYQPQLVCINLGTNDFSTNNYDESLYEKNYRLFLALVRSKYPTAKIVLLSGPMLGDKENNIEKKILNEICKDYNKKGDKQIYRFDFSFQTGDLGYGASWHPSKKQHLKMANELLPFLRSLMKW
jgi:lysophospholipase L1-like esterase